MATQEVTITTRSRKLGFGWSTGPAKQSYNSYGQSAGQYIPAPETPDYVGTVRQIAEALAGYHRTKRRLGCYTSFAWFVGDKPITEVWDMCSEQFVSINDFTRLTNLPYYIQEFGPLLVRVSDDA